NGELVHCKKSAGSNMTKPVISGNAPPVLNPESMSGAMQAEGLQRKLSQRQLTMSAIGGAIGVGLFLGSSVTIHLAGPGVIVTYLFGAVIALVIAYALAEMAVVHPVVGSFGLYAERYFSRWAGFSVRATYGLIQIIAIGALKLPRLPFTLRSGSLPFRRGSGLWSSPQAWLLLMLCKLV